MIASNSLARQKEGIQGVGGRKRQRIKESEAKHELRRQARTLPQVFLGQGCWMRGTGENMDGGMGFHSAGRAEGARNQFYPLTIRMEGATKGLKEFRKGIYVVAREVCFFSCYLWGTCSKVTVMSQKRFGIGNRFSINPLMAIGNYSYQFLICCPRYCVSRHNGGTSVPPLNPSESIVLSEHYRL